LGLLADAADDLGNGILELTVRANVQVRGLQPSGEHELAARLRAAGLLPSDTHDRVRNILGSPRTGLPGRGDVVDLIEAFDEELCDRPGLAELPGRFLFAIDDGSADVAALAPDVGVMAVGDSFAVLLGGAPVGRWIPRGDVVATMLAAAEAFLDERAAQHSPAWRLAELTDGPSRVLARIETLMPMQRTGPAVPDLSKPDVPTGPDVVEVPDGKLSSARAREIAALGDDLRVTPWRSIITVASERAVAIATTSSDVTGKGGG
jgi:precorrin-3B synthase